jgi:GNAT superfamily N-acetyltransferase
MFEEMKHRTPDEHKVGDDSYRLWATAMMKRNLLHCFIITSDGGDVAAGGCLWLREEQPGPGHPARRIPYLMSMYTEPKFRRRGLATTIAKETMRWSKKNGYPEMTLHASRMGRNVYPKLGWKRTWEMIADLDQSSR